MKRRADGRYQQKIMIDGKSKFFYGKSISEVNKKILAYEKENENSMLLKNVAEAWKEEHYKTIAYKTQTGYNAPYNRIVERFGDMQISALTPKVLNQFILSLAKQNYALKTVKTHLLILNLIFNYALFNEYITNNIVPVVKVPKNLKQEKRELPDSTQVDIVKSSVNIPFGLFAYFILYTGCRRGEALALTYEDIDRENNVIRINKSLYYEGNQPKLKTPKTSAGFREIILLDNLSQVLPKGKGILFNENGNFLKEHHFKKKWKKYIEESGVTVTPHQLRHSYATILFEAGISDKDAQELLGHSSIMVTRDIYTHISKKRKSDTADLLNKFVSK